MTAAHKRASLWSREGASSRTWRNGLQWPEGCLALKPNDIDGSEDREIKLALGEHTMSFKGQPYLLHFTMPNFYFHCTTAYDILRHCGVELGKRDFIGTI